MRTFILSFLILTGSLYIGTYGQTKHLLDRPVQVERERHYDALHYKIGLDVDLEEKVLNLWDNQQRKEVPQKKQVLMPLLGQQVTLGVLKVIEDKYNSPGETITRNNTDKVFRAEEHLTTAEIRKGQTEADFYTRWSNKNTGNTVNKAKGAQAQPMSSPTAAAPTKKLFG